MRRIRGAAGKQGRLEAARLFLTIVHVSAAILVSLLPPATIYSIHRQPCDASHERCNVRMRRRHRVKRRTAIPKPPVEFDKTRLDACDQHQSRTHLLSSDTPPEEARSIMSTLVSASAATSSAASESATAAAGSLSPAIIFCVTWIERQHCANSTVTLA